MFVLPTFLTICEIYKEYNITFPEHLSSSPVFSGVRVTRSLVLYVIFVVRYCPFVLFLLAIVCSSSIDRWYLQTLLHTNTIQTKATKKKKNKKQKKKKLTNKQTNKLKTKQSKNGMINVRYFIS